MKMDYEKLLNEKQYEAVCTDSQNVRIIAGAGSGKTRVLTYRISYLLNELNIKPYQILAIAFTNKVAKEMKERALSLVHDEDKKILNIYTFHGFCARFLRQEIEVLNFTKSFNIYDEDDQEKLIKFIAEKHGYKRNSEIVKESLNFIRNKKCKGLYPEDVVLENSNSNFKTCLEFFFEYEELKTQGGFLDFDDLLLKTIFILKNHIDIKEKWQNRFKHILIDEFQDTNDIQFELIRLLSNKSTCLYVVGDPDQTIYTWRGANFNIMLEMNKTFENVDTIILDQNYRSRKEILDVANKLISHNKNRIKKNLFTKSQEEGIVNLTVSYSREEEATQICNKIESLVSKKDENSYKDIVILYRAAYLTAPIEKEFLRRRIPYFIFGGVKFYQRKEVKDIISYFRLIYNDMDNVSFDRIVNNPRRNIGDKTKSILYKEATDANLSYYQYAKEIENYESELSPKVITGLSFAIKCIEEAKKALFDNVESYPIILRKLIDKIGYLLSYANEEEKIDKTQIVNALFDDILDYAKENPDSKFEQYLEDIALQTSQDEVKNGNYVSLMTVHIAKGLEFNYVFLMSLMDQIFPSNKTLMESGDKGLEEERRLCYVAFTRAKKGLYISANESYSFVLEQKARLSQFVEEAGIKRPYKEYNSFKERSNKLLFTNKFSNTFEINDYVEEIQTNNVDKWEVGDICKHDKFNKGTVIEVIDNTIVKINFEEHGVKSIMSNHKFLHKLDSKGDA